MSIEVSLNKYNLDVYLKKLAYEYRKLVGNKMPAEIILVGGAAILTNYGFREKTYDIDAIVNSSSAMKEAINKVGDEMHLPNGWLNSDFKNTDSYSPKLIQHSKYYKTFCGVLDVRTITREYLIAMKLMSGRQYKNDLSDVIGILGEERRKGTPISIESIKTAVCDLFGSWEILSEYAKSSIDEIFKIEDLGELYDYYLVREKHKKDKLIEFQEKYPKAARNANIDELLKRIDEKKKSNNISQEQER